MTPGWTVLTNPRLERCGENRYLVTAWNIGSGAEWTGWIQGGSEDVGSFSRVIDGLHDSQPCRVLLKGDEIVGKSNLGACVNPVTLLLMDALGIDVDGALAWATSATEWSSYGAGTTDHDDSRTFLDERGELVIHVGHVGWSVAHRDVVLPGKDLPEAVLKAMEGRLLRDVVDLPILAELELPVIRADHLNGALRLQVVPGSHIPLPLIGKWKGHV